MWAFLNFIQNFPCWSHHTLYAQMPLLCLFSWELLWRDDCFLNDWYKLLISSQQGKYDLLLTSLIWKSKSPLFPQKTICLTHYSLSNIYLAHLRHLVSLIEFSHTLGGKSNPPSHDRNLFISLSCLSSFRINSLLHGASAAADGASAANDTMFGDSWEAHNLVGSGVV
jgi:hypothetical protein